MAFRKLKQDEIRQLQKQNCWSESWNLVEVSIRTKLTRVWNCGFYGNIKIGSLLGKIETEPGISKDCGIYDSYLQNVEIADSVLINNVKNLANYIVSDNVVLENIDALSVTGESTFGNGTELEILNEGGGRDLPIFDQLTSNLAYIIVNYRHNPKLIKKLLESIEKYVESVKSDVGVIDTNARIVHSGILRNLKIGPFVRIEGAAKLENGTVKSSEAAPVFIGKGVQATDFIICEGAKVDGNAVLDKCFIGQATKIGKQYSAENSALFANCEAFHGEGCSVFGGPYTVTHHKSSLLIAGLFSFYNAGSGTNQSNHMYKLGPIHQGILERGSKTGSFSYMLWPSRVGAFSAVIGKHYTNFDTSEFPFSYVNEEDGKSVLTPAMNLITVGTKRDSEKWPNRDKRNGEKADLISFDLFSPYILSKIVNALEIMKALYEKTPKERNEIRYKGVWVKRLMLKSTQRYYKLAVNISIGEQILKRLKNKPSSSAALKKALTSDKAGTGQWIDMSGMLTAKSEIDAFVNDVSEGKLSEIHDVLAALKNIHEQYDNLAWNWFADLIEKQTGKVPAELSVDEIREMISAWETAKIKFNGLILNDAKKEFDQLSRIGFGIDGDAETVDLDFAAVRGDYDTNKFVVNLQKETEEVKKTAAKMIELLDSLK